MKLGNILWLTAFALVLPGCGGGGGGNSGGDTSSRESTQYFANANEFVPYADTMIDSFIQTYSNYQNDEYDDDLTGTWLYLQAEAGTDQIMDSDPANQLIPLDSSSYEQRNINVVSIQESGDTLTVYECGGAGLDGVGAFVYTFTRLGDGNQISMHEQGESEEWALQGSIVNNKILRFSTTQKGSFLSYQLPPDIHRYTSATSVTYVKISRELNALVGAYNDAIHDGSPVQCLDTSQVQEFTGMFPNASRMTFNNSDVKLKYYVDGLSVMDMPVEQYQGIGYSDTSMILEQNGVQGKLQFLIQ